VRYDRGYTINHGKKKYFYLEEVITKKCDTFQTGFIHKKGHNSTIRISYVIENAKNLDIIAAYTKTGTYKLYNFIYDRDFDKANEFDLESYENNLKKYLNKKYDFSNIPYKDKYFYTKIVVNKFGFITECSIEDNPFDSFGEEEKKAIYDDIITFIKGIHALKPATVFEKPVNYTFKHCFGL
jgi:hypothetical protein